MKSLLVLLFVFCTGIALSVFGVTSGSWGAVFIGGTVTFIGALALAIYAVFNVLIEMDKRGMLKS